VSTTIRCRAVPLAGSPEVDMSAVAAVARDSEVLMAAENSCMMPVIKSTIACARVMMRLQMEAELRWYAEKDERRCTA